MNSFNVMSNPREIYSSMLKDIASAKKIIYLETYIYDYDRVGHMFRKALIEKAKQGVKIKLLIDAWGSSVKKDYFKQLEKYGAEVKFFREFLYTIRIFSKNHERNHRKLLIIDNDISYLGSINITNEGINYRELVLRLTGNITSCFIRSFNKSWEVDKLTKKKIKSFVYKEFEIINDFPSYYHQVTQNRYLKLIKKARKCIRIETPYFIPSYDIRKAISRAIKRGVKVTLTIPWDSNVRIVDIVRNRYLGKLHKEGVKIYFYRKSLLHSKLMIIDDKFFILGSSNLDYRSFIHTYEINFLGNDKELIDALIKYNQETISKSEQFNYYEWKNRSSFREIIEMMASWIEYYL